MLAFYVDYNSRERFPDGRQAIHVAIGTINPPSLENKLTVGLRATLYDEEIKCVGILRRGKYYDWVADIVPGTVRDLSRGEFNRLRSITRRSAFGIV